MGQFKSICKTCDSARAKKMAARTICDRRRQATQRAIVRKSQKKRRMNGKKNAYERAYKKKTKKKKMLPFEDKDHGLHVEFLNAIKILLLIVMGKSHGIKNVVPVVPKQKILHWYAT